MTYPSPRGRTMKEIEHDCGMVLSENDIAANWCPWCAEYLDLALAKRTEPRFRGERWIGGHIVGRKPS